MDRGGRSETPTIGQCARFLKTARALGCDEDEAAFGDMTNAVVRPADKVVGKSQPSKPRKERLKRPEWHSIAGASDEHKTLA